MRSPLALVTAAALVAAQQQPDPPSSTVIQIWFPPPTSQPLRPSSASASAATPTFTGYPRLSASLINIDASQNRTTLSLACVLPSSVCAIQPEGVRTLTVGPGVYIAPLYEIGRSRSSSMSPASVGSANVPISTTLIPVTPDVTTVITRPGTGIASDLGSMTRPSVTVPGGGGVPSRVFSIPTEGVTSAAAAMMMVMGRRQENDDNDNAGNDGSTTRIYTSSCTYSLTPTAAGQCMLWSGTSTASPPVRTYAASLVVLSDVTITAGLEKWNATMSGSGTVVSSPTVIVTGSQTLTTTVPVTTSTGAAAVGCGGTGGGVVAAVAAAVAAAFV